MRATEALRRAIWCDKCKSSFFRSGKLEQIKCPYCHLSEQICELSARSEYWAEQDGCTEEAISRLGDPWLNDYSLENEYLDSAEYETVAASIDKMG